ncbi:MAG: hypothetical protein P8074_08085 [Anaerolineales bacterium]
MITFSLILVIAVISGGCVALSDPEVSQEYRADVVETVTPAHVVGQTFISRRARLNSIQLWLRPAPEEELAGGTLVFNLYHGPQYKHPLASVTLDAAYAAYSNPVTITFPAQDDPPGQAYYFSLNVLNASVQALGRSEDAYAQGQAFLNGQPINADLAFRASYDYDAAAVLDDLEGFLSAGWLVIPLALALWLPGRLLLTLTALDRRFDSGERMALSVGLSLAAIPVLMTWTTFLGLRWNRVAVWATGLALAGVYLWLNRQTWLNRLRNLASGEPLSAPAGNPSRLMIALAAIFLLALFVRLAMVRDQSAPLWVDPVHHAMITRLIVEQGAFPDSYAPYLNIETSKYHAGFHSIVAVFHWLSGLEISQAMLILGQVLNALSVFAVYLFTTTFVKNKTAGIVAAGIAGLFTPMPAYYTSWGRYTQLASLLILPAAAALILLLVARRARLNGGILALASLAAGGLFLTHYRVVAFLALLLLAYLVGEMVRSLRSHSLARDMRREISRIGLTGGLAIAFTLPWWPATLNTLLIPKLSWGQGATVSFFSDFSWSYLDTGLGMYTLALAGIGLAWGILQRRIFPYILALWVALMFLLANLSALSLPGGGFVNNTSVEITLFLPLAALGGYLIAWLIEAWRSLLPLNYYAWFHQGVAVIGVILAVFGARSILPILNPVTMLFREADRPAIHWIAEHVPPGETILVNPFAWGYGIYAGNDGGYWISSMAGHETMPPPVLYGLANQKEKTRQITEITSHITEISDNAAELQAYLLENEIHYVYVGVRGGALSPQTLQASGLFKLLYDKDGAWVFEVQPQTSANTGE